VELLPDWLPVQDHELILTLRDLDGDGDLDLLARSSKDRNSIDRIVFTYFVLLNDGQRMIPEQPDQVLRFEGSGTESAVTDVDGDGRPDLIVTKWELPSLKELFSGFKLRRSTSVFFAGKGTPFEKKFGLHDEQVFSIDSLQDALVLRFIEGDLSGDGIADMVEVGLGGDVLVRRIVRRSRFLGPDEWQIEAQPWKRFEMGVDLRGLKLLDINGDGLPDLLNPGRETLALMLSQRGREASR
jgi:hypothetical protein